jgi:hypothetical protein
MKQSAKEQLAFVAFFLFITGVILLTAGCGMKASGGTVHRVEGEATVKIVVGVDVSVCQGLPDEQRFACVNSLVELATKMAEMQGNKVIPEEEAEGE